MLRPEREMCPWLARVLMMGQGPRMSFAEGARYEPLGRRGVLSLEGL